MKTGTAISELKRVKPFIKAFEHIEDVLKTAHAAEGVISSLNIEVEHLDKEVKKAKSALKSKESALAAFLQLEIEKRKKATRETLAVEIELKKNLSKHEADFKTKINKEKDDFNSLTLAMDVELKELGVKISSAKAELITLRSSISGLQSQIGSLQPGG